MPSRFATRSRRFRLGAEGPFRPFLQTAADCLLHALLLGKRRAGVTKLRAGKGTVRAETRAVIDENVLAGTAGCPAPEALSGVERLSRRNRPRGARGRLFRRRRLVLGLSAAAEKGRLRFGDLRLGLDQPGPGRAEIGERRIADRKVPGDGERGDERDARADRTTHRIMSRNLWARSTRSG